MSSAGKLAKEEEEEEEEEEERRTFSRPGDDQYSSETWSLSSRRCWKRTLVMLAKLPPSNWSSRPASDGPPLVSRGPMRRREGEEERAGERTEGEPAEVDGLGVVVDDRVERALGCVGHGSRCGERSGEGEVGASDEGRGRGRRG